ncbi:MAG: hypothetical protein CMG00_03345 [Candidatus Marinimicrobia bacterium]|nr:hypothetical protein [Candidatus Neomarinimicrobiota bacterium]
MYDKIFIFFLLVSTLCSQAILHVPIEESIEKTPILIEAFIDLPDYEIKNVTLYFRSKGEIKYLESTMFKIDSEYLGEIPASFVEKKGLEYFLVVDTYNMGFIGLPNIAPTDNPFRILVNEKKFEDVDLFLSEFDAKYTILNPEQNSEVVLEDLVVSVSYFDMENIDNFKTNVLINNVDVSSMVDFRNNYFVYYPENITEGNKIVEVTLIDDFGVKYNPIKWEFDVVSEETISLLDFKQSGKFKTDYTSSSVDTTKLDESTADFNYSAEFDWINIRSAFHLSSLESSMEQPKNRFFLDFRSEFYRLRIGDIYPNIGTNFIKRNRVRGLDFSLNSDKYKFNFISGEINRAVQGNPFGEAMKISDEQIDPIYNDDGSITLNNPSFSIDRGDYTFARKLTAFNVQFPIKNNMKMAFSVLKSKDNIASVYQEVAGSVIQIPNSLNEYIDNQSYIYSSYESIVLDTLTDDQTGDFLIDSQTGEYVTQEETITTNYILYSDLKNKYPQIFNSTLLGEGECSVLPDQYLDANQCAENGGEWLLQGVCYRVDDITGEVTDSTLDNFTNKTDCDQGGGHWVFFFNMNILTSDWQGSRPKDNFIIGGDFEALFDRDRLKFETGFSLSLLNENTWDPVLTYEALDTLGGDPQDDLIDGYAIPEDILKLAEYESLFQTGINQVPLIPIDIVGGSSIFNILTMPSLAYHVQFEGDYYGHKISYKLNQIGPEYNTLGNIYLQKDIREQILSDKIALLDNQLYVNLRYKLTEEDVAFDNKEKGKTNKFDILMNFSPGAGLARLGSAISYQSRTNGVFSNDFVEYEELDGTTSIDIDSRKEKTETLQYNFSLTTPFEYYGSHNFTISYYKSKKDDLVADENILTSIESGNDYDDFPYISPRTETSTVNFSLQSSFSPFSSTVFGYSKTSFDYGLDISNYYRVRDINLENVFTCNSDVQACNDGDYDIQDANTNIENFELNYSDILFAKQELSNLDFEVLFKSFVIFDKINFGLHFSMAEGIIDFNQLGISCSTVNYIFEDFYLTFDYKASLKDIVGEKRYNNSTALIRFGYEF